MQRTTGRLIALAIIVSSFAALPTANAAGIGVYGVAGLSGTASTPPPTYGGKFNAGFGAFVRGDMIPGLDLEIGATLLKRTYNLNDLATFDYQTLELPIMLRVTAIPILTVGGGIYGAFKLGSQTTDPAVAAVAPTVKGFDFGLVGALGVEFPFGPAGVFAELRYLFGLTNMDDGGGSFQTRNMQGIAGVRIGI